MKIHTYFLLLLFTGSLWADGRLNTFGRVGDKRYSTSITQEALKVSSQWQPGDGKIPLDQLDALAQSRALLDHEFPDFGLHQVVGVTLAESHAGTWLYKVTFISKPKGETVRAAGGSLKPSMLTYFILLNGSTISPIEVTQKQSSKPQSVTP